MTPHLDRYSNTAQKLEMLKWRDERNVRGIGQAHMFRKDNFLGKDKEWGMVIMGLGAALPNHIHACRSEFWFWAKKIDLLVKKRTARIVYFSVQGV